jgi:DNA-binding NtrC family response regulator
MSTATLPSDAVPIPATILIVDDVAANLGALSGSLEKCGHRVLTALSGAAALKTAAKVRPDLILLDLMMPEMDGLETCRRLKADSALAHVPVIFITANTETVSVVEGFTVGGVDYITKPFRIEEVFARVSTHLRLHRLTRELGERNAQLEAEVTRRQKAETALHAADERLSLLSAAEARQWGLSGFIGRSPLFGQMVQELRSVQGYPRTNVLLTGESGSGKELIARAIHFGGAHATGPFVPVNCSALPGELAESHLFGHLRGAFTGATNDRKGWFELAHQGTLFLDEIGDMPLLLQAKLLRVLEDGIVTPVGATAGRRVSVRVVAATNVNLPAKIAAGQFREDLYYRLNHFNIVVPPLRHRRDDIPVLAAHFLKLFALDLKRRPPVLHAEAMERLLAHDYPGNIRELKNTIERAVIHAGCGEIRAHHIVFASSAPLRADAAGELPPRRPNFNLAEAENRLITEAIAAAEGNLSAAARLLGVNRALLYRWQERQARTGALSTG